MTEVEIFRQSLDVSRIVMVITILMAVTTVVFSALTMAFERSHNKRSVRPYCSMELETAGGRIRVSIRNAGLGPMVLESLDLVDGEGNKLDSEGFASVLAVDGLSIARFPKASPPPPLSPGDGRVVLEFAAREEDAARLGVASGRCRIRIAYSDLYGQKYRFDLGLDEA